MKAHRFTIADDDPDALFLLHRMIEQQYPNSSISMFSNAEDALAHIRDTGTDILITNHGMGTMSGTDLSGSSAYRKSRSRSLWFLATQQSARRRRRRVPTHL